VDLRGLTPKAAAIVADTSQYSIHERLQASLADAATGHDKRLARALDTAAQQLEYLTPAMLLPTSVGLQTGMATQSPRRAIVFVLAEGRRCFTVHVAMPDVPQGFAEMVEVATQLAPRDDDLPNPAAVAHEVIRHWGARPGQPPTTRESPDWIQIGAVLGALLRPIPADARGLLAEAVEHIRGRDVCPAMVALIGPSSSGVKGKMSFVWPLLLPVAEYAEAFTDRADFAAAPRH
jgi:hypothetical protein